MICPRCAANQLEDIKFCTSCGANLEAVREVLERRDTEKKFDWSNTWVAEMFMSGQAHELRKLEMERRMGITPEVKRYREIKAGVIVTCAGFGLTVFLLAFFGGLANQFDPDVAPILTRIWMAGIIPIMVGLALIINGLVVSKKLVEIAAREQSKTLEEGATPRVLRAADTSQFIPTNMSVTEGTTRHLSNTGSDDLYTKAQK